MWPLLAILFACQEPFGADRHDLIGTRIAALTADDDGAVVRPTIALLIKGRPWSNTAAEVDWYWIEEPGQSADIEPGAPSIGQGPAPELPRQGSRLAVIVRTDDSTLRAELDVDGRSVSRPALQTARVDGLDLEGLEGPQMELEARRALESTPSHQVAPGEFARFQLVGMDGDSRARFMATGDGTFFELDLESADWVAGTLILDDGEIEELSVGSNGPITVIGLEIGESHSGFAAADLFVGEPPIGAWVAGRFLSAEQPSTGRMWALLAPDDLSPTGLRLRDLLPAEPEDTWNPSGLACEGVSGASFDPSWLLQHRCLRNDIVGQRVLVEVRP